jgi:hypothetical protein
VSALLSNTTGENNTATGFDALPFATASSNIALGAFAGYNVTTGSNNIDIGARGHPDDFNTIRIGNAELRYTAYMQGIYGTARSKWHSRLRDPTGKLGTATSSARFKEAIQPMGKASEAILALHPVSFRYKSDLDPDGISQFGLVAEQVEKVNPDLVARDAAGQPYTVRYEAVNAMLLNEFLKEHCKNEEQQATIAQLKSGMEALTATVKEQAAQIQKVSAQLETSKPAPQVVNNP